MSTRILLIRHGGTILSKEKRFAGAIDVPLADEGREQARALSRRLANLPIAAAYCSPMSRTVETATLIAAPHNLELRTEPDLREINHGSWEGLFQKDVKSTPEYIAWDEDPIGTAPPGGETGLQVLARALPVLRRIVLNHPKQTVLVVAHKATNRLLITSALGMDPRVYRERIRQDPACMNILDYASPASAQAALLNDTSHYASIPGDDD